MKNYKKLKQLKSELFKRLTGSKPDTFKAMLQEYELSHERKKSKGGKPNKLNLRMICTAIAMTNINDLKFFKQLRLPIKKRDSSLCRYRLAKLHKNTEMLKKKTKLNPLTDKDKLENKNKSSKRIPVEYINAKIKAFKIVSTKYRNRRKRYT